MFIFHLHIFLDVVSTKAFGSFFNQVVHFLIVDLEDSLYVF